MFAPTSQRQCQLATILDVQRLVQPIDDCRRQSVGCSLSHGGISNGQSEANPGWCGLKNEGESIAVHLHVRTEQERFGKRATRRTRN